MGYLVDANEGTRLCSPLCYHNTVNSYLTKSISCCHRIILVLSLYYKGLINVLAQKQDKFLSNQLTGVTDPTHTAGFESASTALEGGHTNKYAKDGNH